MCSVWWKNKYGHYSLFSNLKILKYNSVNGLNLLTWCWNSFTTAKKGLSDFQFLQWKNLDLFPSFFIVKTNGFSDHVFTSSANPDSVRRIHCQIRTKKLFVQKERVQLNRVQNKSNFTRKLANFYLLNVASIRFSTFENVVLDENILKIGRKKLIEIFFKSKIQNKIYFTRKLCNFYLRNVDSIRFSILKNMVLEKKSLKL